MNENTPDAAATSTGLLDTAFDFLNRAGQTYNNFTAQKDKVAGTAVVSKPGGPTAATTGTPGLINTQTVLLIGGAIVAVVLVVSLSRK